MPTADSSRNANAERARGSLQRRALVVVVATTACLIIAIGLPLRLVLLDSFLQLEDSVARSHMERARAAVDQELDMLWTTAHDYANWDDTYAFVAGKMPDYPAANFIDQTLDFNKLSAVALYDVRGKPLFIKGYDLATKKEVAPPAELAGLKPTDLLQAARSDPKRIAGVVQTADGPLLVAALAVHNSLGKGDPQGTLIMGHRLDPLVVGKLARTLKLDVTVTPVKLAHGAPDRLAPNGAAIRMVGQDALAGFARIDDVYGEPYLVLRVMMARDVYRRGQEAMELILVAVLVAGMAFGLAVHVALKKMVLQPVQDLSERVRKVADRKDHALRLQVEGRDEIASLGHDINGMLDALQGLHHQLNRERQRAESLLLNILPRTVADRLKAGEQIADSFREVSVLFADLVGFTSLASQLPPAELLPILDEIFSAFDELADRHGLEKIKTIGDAYMVVAGVPEPVPDHAKVLAAMALDMVAAIDKLAHSRGLQLQVRVGIHTGPVTAGVIGKRKFSYDLWGDTVNVASRMESAGVPGRVQITETTLRALGGEFETEERGPVAVKGKGEMTTWLLVRPLDASRSRDSGQFATV